METAPIAEIATQFLARASSTSEVLTLNLTNLLILVILKAIIFGFGLFSVGNLGKSQYERARSSSGSSSLVKSSDVTGGMCFMMFMSGDAEKEFCIKRSACEDPETAENYLLAGKMIYKGYKLLQMDVSDSYYNVMKYIEEAKDHSINGGDCAVYPW